MILRCNQQLVEQSPGQRTKKKLQLTFMIVYAPIKKQNKWPWGAIFKSILKAPIQSTNCIVRETFYIR